MYERAPSQSASDGLKPYVWPSQRMSKPLARDKLGFCIFGSEKVRLAAGGKDIVRPSVSCNGVAWMVKAKNGYSKRLWRVDMV